MLEMGIGKVLVVVNSTPDKGATRGFLANFLGDQRVSILDMFEGYSWCNALNRALMTIQIHNCTAKGEEKISFVLNVSVETKFNLEHIKKMLDAFCDNEKVALVGTTFEGLQSGNHVVLGRSYRHPRNTGLIIKIKSLGVLFSGFDPFCDNTPGGMEDIDFILRMLALSDLEYIHMNLLVPLIVGVNYHQPTKEQKEKRSMEIIIDRWRSWFGPGTVERERIDKVISEMRLEED
jgi:hypothetical protein